MTDRLKHIVRIRRNTDGRIAEYHTDVDTEYAPTPEEGYFIWEEGNFACDCNRYSFFCRAIGEDETDDNPPCGNTRFTVIDITFEDGTVYYPDGNKHDRS